MDDVDATQKLCDACIEEKLLTYEYIAWTNRSSLATTKGNISKIQK